MGLAASYSGVGKCSINFSSKDDSSPLKDGSLDWEEEPLHRSPGQHGSCAARKTACYVR